MTAVISRQPFNSRRCLSICRRSFFVGLPCPFPRVETRWENAAFAFINSSSGVRSSINSSTSLADILFSTSFTTRYCPFTTPLVTWMISPSFIWREGFIRLSAIFTFPELQAAVASVRVLNMRTAQSHLSILIPSPPEI